MMWKTQILASGVLVVSLACGTNGRTDTATQNQVTGDRVEGSQQTRPSASNELPFGSVDLPKPGTVAQGGRVIASGWAVDDSAVKEVRMYVDSRFWARTTLTIPRDDLQAPLPGYMHGTNLHGWSMDIDLSSSPGMHNILAQAVDDQGATRDIGSVAVTVPAAR